MQSAQLVEADSSECRGGGFCSRRGGGGRDTVLIEPHSMTRRGLQHLLEEARPGCTLTAVATPEEVPAPQLSRACTVLLSIRALTERVRHLRPLWSCCCTRLVLLAGSRDRDRLDRDRLQVAAQLPIDAVLREEDLSDDTFAETLDALGRGTVSVSRNTMRELFALAADAGPQAPHLRFQLTARELAVLELMTPGLSNRQIAKSMGITEHGVKRHVANILVKLGCHNRTMAVASGIRLGLVNVESVPSAG